METPEKDTEKKKGKPNKLPKGHGSYYQRVSTGTWYATVTLPSHDGGRTRRRKTVIAKNEADAKAKARALYKELNASGDIPTKTQTFGSWADIWFNSIAVKKVRPKTAATYRSYLQEYILPTIGNVQLLKLTPAHIRRVHDYVVEGKGLSSTTAVQAHRIMAVCLKHAEREGRVPRNVANFTDAPRKATPTLTPLSAIGGLKVLQTVSEDRLGSRYAAALLAGGRQGELLGIEIDRVSDLLDLSWQLQRLSWEHGCGGKCGRIRGTDCPTRKLTAPADWEHRHLTGGLWLSRPKSDAGWRMIPLVDPLRSIIERRMDVAATEPNPHGLLWTADRKLAKGGGATRELLPLDGSPIDPSRDNHAWHEVLVRAGIEHVAEKVNPGDKARIIKTVRLHDARHTTASLLLKANVAEPLIMKILGHSSYAVSRGYQNIDEEQLGLALTKMSALLT